MASPAPLSTFSSESPERAAGLRIAPYPDSQVTPATEQTSAYEAQQSALAALPSYSVQVVRRTSHKDPEVTDQATYYEETVRYDDGAVRLATIAVPRLVRCAYPISTGDPWYTGPSGFNRAKIKSMAADGFVVVANHHQGRHAFLPTSRDNLQTMAHFLTSKGVGKSAAQDHALLDDLGRNASFPVDAVIRDGYSRSAVAGEAFIAQTATSSVLRTVEWSDLEAAVFARKVGHLAFLRLLSQQVPHELKTLSDIGLQLARGETANMSLSDYLGTVDVHPLNIVHEVVWLGLLLSGDAGIYAKAVPLDARGIRTTYRYDYASQQADWQAIHEPRKNLTLLQEAGGHLAGATPSMRHKRRLRFQRLRDYAERTGSLNGVSARHVLPPEDKLLQSARAQN